jgi:hypothetical protein
MRRSKTYVAAVAVAVLAGLALAGPGKGKGNAKGRPGKGRSVLAIPMGTMIESNDKGTVDARFFPVVGKRAERSWLRFKLRRLDAGATYTLWADDPSTDDLDPLTTEDAALVQVTTVEPLVANGDGALNLMLDTKHGATLPFGATLAGLAGKPLEVRDAAGTTVLLVGTLPTLR